jgi:WD40 repeat protein
MGRRDRSGDANAQRHSNYVTSVAFSPDDARIVSASLDGKIKMWETDLDS